MRLKPQLSGRNPWKIEKHRYYELKHFCLQYDIWRKELIHTAGFSMQTPDLSGVKPSWPSNPTEDIALRNVRYLGYVNLIDEVCEKTDSELSFYIKMGVTRDLPYEALKSRYDIPCCRDTYYDRYRCFFWMLDRARE